MHIGSEKWRQILIQGAADLQVELSPQICDPLTLYAQQLLVWSEKINLTAIRDPHQVAVKHFLDSMAPVHLLGRNAWVLDIGSGAGFPGLPLKLIRPDLKMVLIDAVRKKVSFMQHIIRLLDLRQAAAYHWRADELTAFLEAAGGPDKNGSVGAGQSRRLNDLPPRGFEIVISRALTSLADFAQMSLPLLSERGAIVALKGQISPEEISEADARLNNRTAGSACGGKRWEVTVRRYHLPYLNSRRSMVSIRPEEQPDSRPAVAGSGRRVSLF